MRHSAVPSIYFLVRNERQSEDQALGVVAHVVEWTDGTCLLKWVTEPFSEERYLTLDDLRGVRLASNRCVLTSPVLPARSEAGA